LRKLWERLGLEEMLTQALREREFVSPVEWAIFAMVSNRALAPDSKPGVEEWAREDVALGNPEPISLQHLYRAMDFLLEHEEAIQKEVFFATADLSSQGRRHSFPRASLLSGAPFGPDCGAGDRGNMGSDPCGDGAIASGRIFPKGWPHSTADRTHG